MVQSFQMKEAVDKQITEIKIAGIEVNENFAGVFRQRERQNIGWLVFTSVNSIKRSGPG